MIDWQKVSEEYIGALPHPQAPQLKVRELPTAVRLATKTKFGGSASFVEATAFWKEFQGMNATLAAQKKPPLTPEEYEHVLERMAPVSFAYHGRPPTLYEIAAHRDSSPAQARQYFSDLPDKHYPDVTAGEMARYLALADQSAREHLERAPNKLEARTFAHAKMGYDGIVSFYKAMGLEKKQQNGNQDQTVRDAPDAGTAPPGRQQTDPRAVGSSLGRTEPAPGR